MDESKISCPICFEVPEAEIYQCINGHIICSTCSTNLKLCPQCREVYGNKKIRARILEDLIGGQELDCANKHLGCKAQVPKRELSHHVDQCRFGGVKVQLCKYMGYSCLHTINSRNIRDTIEHFVKTHGALEKQASSGIIQLENFLNTNFEKTSFWTPFVCDNSKFLVFAKSVGGSGVISLNCVYLGESPEVKENYKIQYKIWKDETQFLSFESPPIRYADMKTSKFTPVIPIDVRFLKQKYLVKGSLQFNFYIRPVIAERMPNRLSMTSESIWLARNRVEKSTDSVSRHGTVFPNLSKRDHTPTINFVPEANTPLSISSATGNTIYEYVWTVKDFYAVQQNEARLCKEKFLIDFGPDTIHASKWEVGMKLFKKTGSDNIGFYCRLNQTPSEFKFFTVKVELRTVSTTGAEVELQPVEGEFWELVMRSACRESDGWKIKQPRSFWNIIQSDGSVNFLITFTVEKQSRDAP